MHCMGQIVVTIKNKYSQKIIFLFLLSKNKVYKKKKFLENWF
jgi:hypothetical protein